MLVGAYELAVGVRVGLAAKAVVTAAVGATTVELVPPVARQLGGNGSA